MPTHKLILEVEVHCPEQKGHPELTIDAQTVLDSLLSGSSGCSGYAVCDRRDIHKLTANMRILKAKLTTSICECCGQTMPTIHACEHCGQELPAKS